MSQFFLSINYNNESAHKQIAKNLFSNTNNVIYTYGNITIIAANEPGYSMSNQDIAYFLSGKIDNLDALKLSYLVENTVSDADVIANLIQQNGWSIVNTFKGTFAIVSIHQRIHELCYTIGNTGLMPAYSFVEMNRILITSSLKALRFTEDIPRKMIPLTSYRYEYTNPVEPDFCFLEDFKRVLPGYVYSMDYSQPDKINLSRKALNPIQSGSLVLTKTEAEEKLYQLLLENVKDKLDDNPDVSIPISGGLDSGLIASFLHEQGKKVYTYTIGTPYGNEFENAKEVHQFVSSVHQEIWIDESAFFEGLLQSAWHNEICDPLYAEGYVGFYHVFKAAKNNAKQVFTGYGADLILGDFLSVADKSTINSFSEYWCKRAAWTGEMSSHVAESFGLEVQHPFWEIELINFGLSIPYSYKYKGEEVKAILRELATHKKLLPPSVSWRTKNALTTGTAIDQLFSAALKIKHIKNYQFKSIFLYYLFEQFFVLDKTIDEIDINQLIHKTKRYVE